MLAALILAVEHTEDIKAKNPSLRAFNERASINARLQGTAADIIRRAMIRMPDVLAQAKLTGRMLLQVHDELVFEVRAEAVDAIVAGVRERMAGAAELAVPLVVDVGVGANWDEAH